MRSLSFFIEGDWRSWNGSWRINSRSGIQSGQSMRARIKAAR